MLPFLRTKTIIPPIRPQLVERPRLLERIRAGTGRALTLITAPAGFGKTTLAADWAQRGEMPVAWLSLQPVDRPRERFISYLIQALQTIAPHLGLTSLALMQGGAPEGVLFALVNDLAEMESDFALVLDDYHSAEGPETNEIIAFLLENRPTCLRIIMTTRNALAFNLARLRALDQVTEITAADLRFTESEIRAFLETIANLHLPPEALARLNQSTEGWAVGLQLAALTLARQPDAWQTLAGQEHIFDYLAEEVLRREPPEIQQFLKITALLDRFCVSLCEHIFAGLRAKELIAHIERANLFLVPLDSTWYRYHALFTDFLRKQAQGEVEGQAAPLYRAASDWFEQNGVAAPCQSSG